MTGFRPPAFTTKPATPLVPRSLERFNPDGMTLDDVQDWEVYLHPIIGPSNDLLPDYKSRNAAQSVVIKLWLYCVCKAEAMENRMSGNIPRAMAFERQCDVLFELLPRDVRW